MGPDHRTRHDRRKGQGSDLPVQARIRPRSLHRKLQVAAEEVTRPDIAGNPARDRIQSGMERAVQFSLSEANKERIFMPVRTSRAALTLALIGALAGALIQVPYARSIGPQLYEPYFFFPIFGASTFASLGCMIAIIFGGTLSRRVCWLYGLA